MIFIQSLFVNYYAYTNECHSRKLSAPACRQTVGNPLKKDSGQAGMTKNGLYKTYFK